jgi:hypothetical protein
LCRIGGYGQLFVVCKETGQVERNLRDAGDYIFADVMTLIDDKASIIRTDTPLGHATDAHKP